jgi:predicted phage terminase large subunit-like protein
LPVPNAWSEEDVTSIWERAAEILEGKRRKWETPGQLATALLPGTRQTGALDLIDKALVAAYAEPDSRLIITMPPQEGKSTRVAKDFVLWVLSEDPDCRVITASYGQDLANRNGRAIRNALTAHPELGLFLAPDAGAVHEWTIAGHEGGVLSVGIGAGVTGRPADLLIIDDPIKDRKEADSPTFRQNVWDWWTDSASTRLAPGAPVVVILTRWHEDDLAGRLLAAEDGHIWKVLNIPAQADHDPDKGEVDVLNRAPGTYMDSARKRSTKQWDAVKVRSGSRTWNALFQGRPSAVDGNYFKRDWWKVYEQPLWIVRPDGTHLCSHFDEMLISWDMAFKNLDTSDYVAGGVWMRRGVDAYLLDRVNLRLDFVETLKVARRLAAKWPQATIKLVEDKANGTAVLASLQREVPGFIPEEPREGKTGRAAAVSPLVESGNVWLPSEKLAPWVGDFIDQCAAFPTAAHDDEVDQMSQALNRLILQPLINGTLVTAEDLDAELAEFTISPY